MNRADNAALQPEVDLDVRIGANVHTLMWRAQEKQAALAVQWGMSQAALSLKLRGRRPWFAAEIDAAARHYKVTRDELFTKLPDLDSNQEPAGFLHAPISLAEHRSNKPANTHSGGARKSQNAVVTQLHAIA